MAHRYQAILLIAFGGPTCREEIRPFLARVTRGIPIPPARLEEVVHHYEAVGGKSPLNEITFKQAAALESALKRLGHRLPVYVGLRHSRPFFNETLRRMAQDGVERVLGFILSAQRTEASWERYQENIAAARAAVGAKAPRADYCDGWHDHPLFIQTWAQLIETAMQKLTSPKRQLTPLIFTAHSVPTAMAERSEYAAQVATSACLIATKIGHPSWSIAYQSRSGRPTDLWLEPDIGDEIKNLAARGNRQLVVAPIGFVCDHVEVLYDLDIEARKIADDLGVTLVRALCPNDHPTFIQMMAAVVEGKLTGTEDRK